MEKVGSLVADKVKEVIQILKSLQREAFSDIMKLRDRQEKVEKLMTMYKSSKGGPFQEASTHVTGRVDIRGALFFLDDVDEDKREAIQRSGIRTGIDARLVFQTRLGDKDRLVAEFVAGEKGKADVLGGPLSLSKVLYSAHVFDWLSAAVVPLGAQYRDALPAKNFYQERGLTNYSEFGPPLLHQHNGSAIGITAKKSKVAASLAQFVSGLGMQVNSAGFCTGIAHIYSTVGELAWQASKNTKISLFGVNRHSKHSGQSINLGTFALPVDVTKLKQFSRKSSSFAGDEDSPTSCERSVSDRYIAVSLKSELDDGRDMGAWLEMSNSKPMSFKWSAMIRDTPEDDFGWGIVVGGSDSLEKINQRFQVETFLNFNLGCRFKIQPAFVYVKDDSTQFPALMLCSTWDF